MNESQALPINLLAPSSEHAPKRWHQLSMLQMLVAMAVATAVSILNLSSSRTIELGVNDFADQKILWVRVMVYRGWPARHFVRELPSRNLDRLAAEISAADSRHEIHALALITNLMVSMILVSAAIALTGQIQRADRATDSSIRRRHVLNRVRFPRLESKLLVAIAIMAVFIAQNSAVRASGPFLTRISRTVDFDLSALESGWPLNHWNAYGMVVSGREFVTNVPSVARYSWSAMATNVACCILSIVVVIKFVSFISWKADRSTGDEANN